MPITQSNVAETDSIRIKRSIKVASVDSYINKHHSLCLYGLAAIAMVYHHLFCIPERLHGYWISIPMLLGINIEITIAWYCKVCVAVFAFLSGYGFVHYTEKKWNHAINIELMKSFWYSRVRKFYPKFWFIAAVFLTYGVLSNKIVINPSSIITTALGLSTQFNGEWWYIKQYLVLVVLFPALYLLLHKTDGNHHLLIRLFLAITLAYIASKLLNAQFYYCLIFIEGIAVAQYRLFDRAAQYIQKTRQARLINITLLVGTFIIRTALASEASSSFPDLIIIAPFIFSVVSLLGTKKNRVLTLFGNHSTALWLSHTFLIYYYFQPIILIPKYSVLIFIWALLLSLAVSTLLDISYGRLSGILNEIRLHK